MHPFRKPSGYKRPLTGHALEQYIDKTKLELSSIPIKTTRNNTFILEREALTSLRNNSNIVIKKADKSNTIVIIDKNNTSQKVCANFNPSITCKLKNHTLITCIA